LILGCTHYPLLRPVLARVLGAGVHLVDSAEVTAVIVGAALGRSSAGSGRVTHYVTGDPLAFEHTAAVIGGVEGAIVPLPVSELAVC
jgi:glutamate racemase